MPRYYFSVEDHVRLEDDEGQELAGPAEARVAAIVFAGDYLSDDPGLVWDGNVFKVVVTDAARQMVVTIEVHAVDGAGA